MHSNDDAKLQSLIGITIQAIDKKDYALCVAASDHILQINPIHSQAIALKCVGLYNMKHYTQYLSNIEYIFENFNQQEIIEIKQIMYQYNIQPDIAHIQLMDELSKEIKREKFIENTIKGSIAIICVITILAFKYLLF